MTHSLTKGFIEPSKGTFYFIFWGGGGVIPRVIRLNVQNLNISITALIPNIGQTVLLAYSGRADVALSEVSSRVPTYTLQ